MKLHTARSRARIPAETKYFVIQKHLKLCATRQACHTRVPWRKVEH